MKNNKSTWQFRRFLRCASGALLLALQGIQAHAAYPERPIRLVVPFPPGTSTDVTTREFTPRLGQILGQPILVDNQAGGGGIVGTLAVAKAPPDGYTLLLASVSHATRVSMQKLPYDTLNDFAPVARLGSAQFVLVVSPEVSAKSVQELLDIGRARPGALNYASTGNGTMGHLAGAQLESLAGVKAVHVPYKGIAQATADIISGRVTMIFYPWAGVAPLVKAGKLKLLATTGERRASFLPDVPTMAESGVTNFLAATWHGIYAPARTPKAIIDTLYSAFAETIKDPAIVASMQRGGTDPALASPEEFAAFTRSEIERYRILIERSGAKAE